MGGGLSWRARLTVAWTSTFLVLAASILFSHPVHAARLGGISTRMKVLTDNDVMIGGFIVGGSVPKTVVVRARGPSLLAAGIVAPLANPVLQLVRAADQAVIATNDDWELAANAVEIAASGLAPTDPLESAVLVTLAPGAYTAIVSGLGGLTGVGLIEVYEVDVPQAPLTGISTRGQVSGGNDVMIGGFVVQGTGPQTVVVRARGPSLAAAGIANALSNPKLTLVGGSTQSVLATNDNWQNAPNAGDIAASGLAPGHSQESAILMTLQPGNYTAIVESAGNGTGVAIVEVWAYAGVKMLANPNTSALHHGYVSQTYTYYLPKNASGAYSSGFIQQGDNPGTPTELTVEWAISKEPGDFEYYKSSEAKVNGQTPCGGVNGAVGGSYYWSLAGSFYECKVDNSQTWYVNVRYLNNCPVGVQCPVSYYHSEW
jgi:hypothetical protein